MDGLLIDSEPLWTEAEKFAFAQVGIDLTEEMRKPTMGLREDLVIDYWYTKQPWDNFSKKDLLRVIVEKVIELVREKGEGMKGVEHVVKFFSDKSIPMAIASSSYDNIINAVIDKLNLTDRVEFTYSAEHEEHGKPHPGVYISTAKKLEVRPEDCLSFEDTFNGLLSAKSARTKCVAVPDPAFRNDPRFSIADAVLNDLEEFDEELWGELSK